jgi:Fe2+ transport system protein FeoA
MKLTDLKPGEQGKIRTAPLYRMKELGLIAGTAFTVVSKGAFSNPIEICAAGCNLLIDRRTAAETEVERCV